jgi:hypothetical protein
MYETKDEPLLPRPQFLARLVGSFGLTIPIVASSLLIGGVGYHYLGRLPWIDAFLNASMILTGMGPVDRMCSTPSKLFAMTYALFSGIAFLTMMAILLAPVLHRMLHKFHLAESDDGGQADDTSPTSERPSP